MAAWPLQQHKIISYQSQKPAHTEWLKLRTAIGLSQKIEKITRRAAQKRCAQILEN